MTILESIILGIVQGLTEFLPVSSSGHLLIVKNSMGITEVNMFFDTMLHVGTLAAVVIVLNQEVLSLLKKPFQKLTGLLIVATLPTVAAALLFNDFIDEAFEGAFLGYGFIWTAILLTLSERISLRQKNIKQEYSWSDSVLTGVMQAIAITPGISRSGATLSGSLFCGIGREAASKFVFLMSIPAILGSVVLHGWEVYQAGTIGMEVAPIVFGTIASMISGVFAVKFMLHVVKNYKLYGFALYTLLMGIYVIVDQNLLHFVF